METVTLTIDGRQVTVEKGKTVLQAAIDSGLIQANRIQYAGRRRGHRP